MNGLRRAGAGCILVFAALLAGSEEHGPGTAGATPADCQRAKFRVVVDVGHTVGVPGAMSARGVPEYTFNLRLGEEIRQALLAAGFDKAVLLVVAQPPPLGLVERARRANNGAADIFLSIHHDSVPDYLLETWEYNGQQNHFSDRFQGYAIFVSNDNADRAGSRKFASLLGRELQTRGLHYTPHYTLPLMKGRRRELVDAEAGVYRFDQLVVLRDTRMAAVLLEAGSIINRQEELELAGPDRRSQVSAAITAAVENFCALRSRQRTNGTVERLSRPSAPVHPVGAILPALAR